MPLWHATVASGITRFENIVIGHKRNGIRRKRLIFFCPKAHRSSDEEDDTFDQLLYTNDPNFMREMIKARETTPMPFIPPKHPLPPVEEDE